MYVFTKIPFEILKRYHKKRLVFVRKPHPPKINLKSFVNNTQKILWVKRLKLIPEK